jgi:hypothetical protein
MMSPENDRDFTGLPVTMDAKLIPEFIQAMTVSASKLQAYPEGHPLIIDSYEKVENILGTIFQSQSQLTLIIAKNTLMLGATTLDPQNLIFQRFAGTLFVHGIIILLEKVSLPRN